MSNMRVYLAHSISVLVPFRVASRLISRMNSPAQQSVEVGYALLSESSLVAYDSTGYSTFLPIFR